MAVRACNAFLVVVSSRLVAIERLDECEVSDWMGGWVDGWVGGWVGRWVSE